MDNPSPAAGWREDALYDKTGREIIRGDILKVYHFTAARRRKRHFMYKQALDDRTFKDGSIALRLTHLGLDDGGYYQMKDGRILPDYEIVQSIDAAFEDRPRIAPPESRNHDD